MDNTQNIVAAVIIMLALLAFGMSLIIRNMLTTVMDRQDRQEHDIYWHEHKILDLERQQQERKNRQRNAYKDHPDRQKGKQGPAQK